MIPLLLISVAIVYIVSPVGSQQLTNYIDNGNVFKPLDDGTKRGYSEYVKISKIVDGDTAWLEDGRKIRYLNIDTPELPRPDQPEECLAQEAYQFNKQLLDDKQVYITYDKEHQDRYGRDLVFIFLDEKYADNIENSINAKIIEQGYGTVLVINPNDTYDTEFYALEREARTAKRGIWGSC